MTEQRKVFGVLLTSQAWIDLSGVLEPYTSQGPIGKYIYCREVNSHGNYFEMVAICENPDGSTFEAEILIPHHYVMCCASASEKSKIGFIQE